MEDAAVAPLEPVPIKLDFSKPRSPFVKAERAEKRLKLFLWGESGSGKTTLALRFPKPAVIDMEKGTEHYGDQFAFDVFHATTAEEVMETVDWLLTHSHEYRTLVIDPITVYWEALQKKWSDVFLARNKSSKGYKHEFYEFQPKDWLTIKSEMKELVRKLLALDMNVILTAHSKAQYADGGFMRAVGETFDAEKKTDYLFDSILKLRKSPDGKFLALPTKDRTGRLPRGEFEARIETFEGAFGKALEKRARPLQLLSAKQKEIIEHYVKELEIDEPKLLERLEHYGASSVEELTAENAAVIIGKLEERLEQKGKTNAQG